MMFYRVSHRDDTGVHEGYTWHPNKRAALRARYNETDTIERVVIDTTRKRRLLEAMQDYAGHPDNG